MSKRGNGYGSENRVNILKKVKVGQNWNLYPAVVELNGKLRDKVRVRGKVEVHPERNLGLLNVVALALKVKAGKLLDTL